MSALALLGAGLAAGVPLAIPPGPAGVIILNLSLRGATMPALRALAALLAAEIVTLAAGVVLGRAGLDLTSWRWMRPAAGIFLLGFALSAWRAAGSERGFTATSAGTVFRIALTNPAIWLSAASVLTVAPGDLAGRALEKVLFISGFEAGAVAWYLGVIFGAARVRATWRRRIERAAVVVIGLIGVWFVSSIL